MFSFGTQKNYLQSGVFKKQASDIIGIIGRVIDSLDQFDKVNNVLIAIGKEHNSRNVTK